MSESTDNSILVVDDDQRFRQIISAPLLAHGYNVVEARTGQEATALMSKVKIGLAIVDYRLPEADGISWISETRERGSQIPIVFISRNVCDAKTFNRLRNILKVSLVLQKPIVPELILEQLEGVLPNRSESSLSKDDQTQINESIKVDNTLSQEDDSGEKGISYFAGERSKETAIQEKVQEALNKAKQAYSKELPNDWNNLAELVGELRENDNDGSRQAIIQAAHKLAGTAGSLGFSEVGLAAKGIEDLIESWGLNNERASDHILIELERLLAQGKLAIDCQDVKTQATQYQRPGGKILLFGNADTVDKNIALYCQEVHSDLIIENNFENALQQAKSLPLDSVIVDLTSDDYLNSLQFCRQLGEIEINSGVPLACIVSEERPIDKAKLLYLGCPQTLHTPVDKIELHRLIAKLLHQRQAAKRRALVIDDDYILCEFFATILAEEGILVETVNDPLQAISMAETFKPDLVILDVMMPGISGYDICRLIKSKHKWSHLPVLYLTSKNTPEGRAMAFKAGGDDFLSKPVTTEELTARTKLHLDKVMLKRQSIEHDALTGCLQRKIFFNRLHELLKDSRSQINNVSISLIEIDLFDELISQHGLLTSEEILVSLGKLIQMRFPREALRARWGEKGFALSFWHDNKDDAEQAINMLAQEFADLNFHNQSGEDFHISITTGIVNFPDEAKNIESILGLANERLTISKKEKFRLLGSHIN
jgi:diguanylate cyclase (GGDEF)-like protein